MPPMSTSIPAHLWDDTEIPAVDAQDLHAGLALWLVRERQGLVLVGEGVQTPHSIDKAVIALFDHPSRGLAVLRRMRALTDALSARRFKHLVRLESAAGLAQIVEIAAGMRLNARYGFSPNKIAWELAAADKAAAVAREAA